MAYADFENELTSVLDKHAPLKKRKPCKQPAPFINQELRKNCIQKATIIYNKYIQQKTSGKLGAI